MQKPQTMNLNSRSLTLIDLYKLGFCKLACQNCNEASLHEPFKLETSKNHFENRLRCSHCGHITKGIPTTFDREKQQRLEQIKGLETAWLKTA